MPFSAIGIGASTWDTLLVLPRYPEEDGKLAVDQVVEQGGGPTATALVAMARLGLRVGYMGAVGCDEPGARMIEEFRHYGVSLDFVTQPEGARSMVAFVLVNQEKGTRTILHRKGDAPDPPFNAAQIEALERCRLLHIEGRSEADLRAARIVRCAGGLVSIDAGTVRPCTEEMLAETDFIVMSAPFLREFTGIDDPEAALCAVDDRFKPKAAVVTRGGEGGIWRAGGRMAHYPAFPVNVRDTTGAGDVFHGAFAYGVLEGWPVERICRFASAVSALKCTRVGGRAGIPTRAEAEAFLEKNAQGQRP